MKTKSALISLAVFVLAIAHSFGTAGGLQAGEDSPVLRSTTATGQRFETTGSFADFKKVTLEFKNTPVMEALTKLAKEADISFAIRGELPKDLRVTVYLYNAAPGMAMNLLCDAAGLSCDFSEGGWTISALPTVNIQGVKVPVVGAVNLQPGSTLPSAIYKKLLDLSRPPFDKDGVLVDLDAKDMPFQEAIKKLFEGSGIEVSFDPALPKDLKVTAKIEFYYRREALILLLDQANLTYTVKEEWLAEKGDHPKWQTRKTEIRIVPQPSFVGGIVGGIVPSAKVCPKCGESYSSEYSFCPLDGSKLKSAAAKE